MQPTEHRGGCLPICQDSRLLSSKHLLLPSQETRVTATGISLGLLLAAVQSWPTVKQEQRVAPTCAFVLLGQGRGTVGPEEFTRDSHSWARCSKPQGYDTQC